MVSPKTNSKQLTFKRTLRQMVICLRPPPLLGCLVLSSTFVGSESGQIQSVKLLQVQNMVSMQGLNTPHPLPATHRKYILYF